MLFFKKKRDNIDIEVACAFTGHRPQRFSFRYNENHPDCLHLKDVLRKEILNQINNGVNTFITGMALGVDIWAAEIVQDLQKRGKQIKLVCAIPCDNQESKWPLESQRRYKAIISKADEVIHVGKEYTPRCMIERNRYMVDRAKNIIAVYDGKSSGGTATTVLYAMSKDAKIVIINPDTLEIQRPH